jgi:ribosomal protein L29
MDPTDRLNIALKELNAKLDEILAELTTLRRQKIYYLEEPAPSDETKRPKPKPKKEP